MISSKLFTCELCGYETNRKYNLKLHKDKGTSCEKRHKRLNNNTTCQNVKGACQNVKVEFSCEKCNKILLNKRNLDRHMKSCKGVDSLQCPTCKKNFNTRQSKNEHIKNVKCSFVELKDEKDAVIIVVVNC